MSEADKMFEELGYEKKIINDGVTGTLFVYEGIFEKGFKRVSFYKDKKISCGNPFFEARLDIAEVKAINKKVEELGWN